MDPNCGELCIPKVRVNIKPLGYQTGYDVPIYEKWMAYHLIPLQEVLGDRIGEVRSSEDPNEYQALWKFEPVGTTESGDLIYMLCTDRLLGCLQFRPDLYP